MNKELFRKIENLLRNYNRLEAKIKLIEGEIENIKEYYTGCVVIGYSEKSGLTNKFSSMVEDEVIWKEKEIFYLKRDLDYKVRRLKRRIDLAI
ncbi:hypothetical protein [Clostridium perfringens]|uniref:hypothetical protein n=1 Tax=Clostridium perfringens TaxID=1502 RepID=UPI001FAABC53|nr:hypothetical protein [Clostridium perfringens]MDK0785856.1 hypothetical protein [Clostridium perfringens]MDK0847413.1 hypothetical protein [Clostridium perfringens]MDM0779813.1 hypothetical protein [Clostridium perfringens]MDM0788612.1 hypothetical protein [Clostridium perfringens]MDM0791628.1 hypothetical protein [Clostridium perfringens]